MTHAMLMNDASMQSIKKLYGVKLGAVDGEIGHVKDFYFDDQSWAVRFVVADTGTWLPGRKVLISPHAFGHFHLDKNVLQVNLTRNRIENCPLIGSHKPVSRAYEEDYYRYYGWPSYWQGAALWGNGDFPILEVPEHVSSAEDVEKMGPQQPPAEAHLRSTQAMNGYQVVASDGISGHVCDFVLGTKDWRIDQLIVRIGHRLSGTEVQLSTSKIERIDYLNSAVCVDMRVDEVKRGSEFPKVAASVAV